MELSKLKLGMTVQGMISGFTGIAAHLSESIHQEPQVNVTPKCKDNEVKDSHFIDIGLVEYVDDGISNMCKEPPPLPFALGDKLRDRATGYTGIFVEKNTYINGCIFCVLCEKYDPEHHKGKVSRSVFSFQELEKIDDGLNKKPVAKSETTRKGGPDRPGIKSA